jgi:hypothetical protein
MLFIWCQRNLTSQVTAFNFGQFLRAGPPDPLISLSTETVALDVEYESCKVLISRSRRTSQNCILHLREGSARYMISPI